MLANSIAACFASTSSGETMTQSLIYRTGAQAAGLSRQALMDFFASRTPDGRTVFVISDMLVTVDLLRKQVVSFQGASEWALDSLVTTDAVWMPVEAKLRQAWKALYWPPAARLHLFSKLNGYRCEFQFLGGRQL
jgi:hypothetical protein